MAPKILTKLVDKVLPGKPPREQSLIQSYTDLVKSPEASPEEVKKAFKLFLGVQSLREKKFQHLARLQYLQLGVIVGVLLLLIIGVFNESMRGIMIEVVEKLYIWLDTIQVAL